MSYVKYKLPVLNNKHKNNLKKIKRDTQTVINTNRKNKVTMSILNRTTMDRYIDKKINENRWKDLKLQKKNFSLFQNKKSIGSFFIKRNIKKSINFGFVKKSMKNIKHEKIKKNLSVKKINLNFEFELNIDKKIEKLKKNNLFDDYIFHSKKFGYEKKFINKDFRCWKKIKIR